ncbi:MAG: ABC transporter ATP-binding protein [Nanoarchaeota archaeon]
MEEKTPNPILNLFKLTWKYSKGRKPIVVFILLSFLIANLIDLITPFVIGKVFNLIQTSQENTLLKEILFLLSFIVILKVAFWAFHGPTRVIERRNAFFVEIFYKIESFNKVLDLPPKWHRDHHSGDTIDKINRSSGSLGRFSGEIFSYIESIIDLIGSLIVLSFISFKSAAIAIFFSSLSFFIIYKFDKILTKQYDRLYLYDNYIAAGIHDYITNIITTITLRLQKMVSKEILTRMYKPLELFRKSVVLGELKWFLTSLLSSLMVFTVLAVYIYDQITLTGTVLIGTLFMLYSYADKISNTFFQFAWRYSNLMEQNAQVIAMSPINEAYNQLPIKQEVHLPKNWEKIELKNLHFSYHKKHKFYHMENININFTKGQKIAFVGESGSGKSTLLVLLRGLYQVKFVDLYVDNKLQEFGLKHLSEHVTLIPQEPELFNTTIKKNITLGISYPDKEINKVIKISAFNSVLKRLRKGIYTNIAEKGVNLSGGEKQRLALARGLLAVKNSDILLLDEPTSSVDTKNEMLIYKEIFRNYKNKTIISSIHRLHLLKNFDYIYYFDKGKIVAEGQLKEVIKNKKFYKVWKNYHKKSKEVS